MDRITRKDAQRAFDRLRREIGKPELEWTRNLLSGKLTNNGGWTLDWIACYGGGRVEDGRGGCPLGNRRMSARECVIAFDLALELLRDERSPKP